MEKINIGIIGVGGYGTTHLKSIDYWEAAGLCHLKAAVIRNQDKYNEQEKRLLSKNVCVYRSYDEMFDKEKASLDLIIIVSGIHEHDVHSVTALEHGCHVLCEKPVAGTIADGLRMREAKHRSGKILAIGYQNIFSPSIQRIKAITLVKKLGRLIKAKSIHLSPRTSAYYQRNPWAGKFQVNGKTLMDSPIQNASAHYLQNMLYVAGLSAHESAVPDKIYGECYQAKPIECADTQFIRVMTNDGVKITAMASHAVSEDRETQIEYTYESGKIIWKDGGETSVYLKEGQSEHLHERFDNGDTPVEFNVYQNLIEAIEKRREPMCTIENSLSHAICIGKLFESSGGTTTVGEAYCEKIDVNEANKEYNMVIKGLDSLMEAMYQEEKSFYEFGAPWASKGQVVKV